MDPLLLGLLAAGALSLGGFALAAVDKRAARRSRRRVAERTFHLLALYGAWPGLLLAFLLLRHKTAKPRFLVPFLLCALVNVAAVAVLAWWLRR